MSFQYPTSRWEGKAFFPPSLAPPANQPLTAAWLAAIGQLLEQGAGLQSTIQAVGLQLKIIAPIQLLFFLAIMHPPPCSLDFLTPETNPLDLIFVIFFHFSASVLLVALP